MHRTAADRPGPGELLAASRAREVALGVILDNALREAFDQSALASLVVPVEECTALRTVDGNRVAVFSHS